MSSPSSLAGERALVTGASGFIGTRLCARLVEAGAEVHSVSRSRREDDGVRRWRTADLSDANAALDLVRDVAPDVVFHLSSADSRPRALDSLLPIFRDSLASTVNMLVASTEFGCRRVLLAGSMAEPDGEPEEPVPISPYAAAKFAAGAYARMFHDLYGLPVVTLRIFMAYGPDQQDDTKLVPYVIKSVLRGEPPVLSSGTSSVDWVYVDDIVEAFVAAAVAEHAAGETLDVATGVLTPVRSVVEELVRRMGPSIQPRFGALPDRPNDHMRVADIARTRELLGWAPQTSLEEGLASTVEWYSSRSDSR